MPLKGFGAYVQKTLQDLGCPGLAIAIVKNDSVVFAGGYGVRQMGNSAQVDEKIIFGIASCSKAFTAASVAMLVDEKKISWDDPAAKYLDGFHLYDPYATREITVRDLQSHRSGLPAFGGDLIWWGATYSRDETLRRIRFVKPASSLRSRYANQNIMFIAADQVVAAATGKTWKDFVKERIFLPLGMQSTSTSIRTIQDVEYIATPHMRVDGKASEAYWKAISGGDSVADAYCSLGILESGAGRTKEAFDCFTQALKHDPRHFESHFNLRNLCFEVGDYRLARTHYQLASELEPNFPNVYFNLGLVSTINEDFGTAVDALMKYKELVSEAEGKKADGLLLTLKQSLSVKSKK